MFFAIELAALALMVCCTVQLWWLSRRLIVERDKAMRDRDSARADRLAAALQEAEDKAEKLMQEAKEARERAARLMQELADLRAAQGGVTAEAVRAAIAPGNPMDTFAREMSNIFAYNGTSEGQEELTNG